MPADKARAKGRQAPDWGAVAEAYANPSESMAAVARRFGISPSTLKRRAEREGWPKRVRRFSGKASGTSNHPPLGGRDRILDSDQPLG